MKHTPETVTDIKEHIAYEIFEYEGDDYERPSEEVCHKIADNILEAMPALAATPDLLSALKRATPYMAELSVIRKQCEEAIANAGGEE